MKTYKYKLYQENDFTKVMDELEKIIQDTQKVIDETFHPTVKEKLTILDQVKKYVADKGYIAYGGTAQNEMIKCKSPNECFYDPLGINDVDCYTPDPVADIVGMANHFHKLGYTNITVNEAIHPGSFSFKIDDELYCDMTYMPENIYKSIPTIQHDGMRLIHPWIPVMDSFRVLTDPLRFSRLFAKHFERSNLILKHFPLPLYTKTATQFHRAKPIVESLWEFIRSRPTIVVFGLMAYRHYLKYVEKHTGKSFKPYQSNIPHIDVFSTDFRRDRDDIYAWLQKNAKKAMYRKYNPFFQFTGNKVSFYCDSALVLQMYCNDHKCIPCHTITLKDSSVSIVTFHMMLGMLLTFYFETKVHEKRKNGDDYLIIVSNLIRLRERFYHHTGHTPLDKTMFKEFIIDCKGATMASLMEASQQRAKKKSGIWRYSPPGNKYPLIRMPNIDGLPFKFIQKIKNIPQSSES